MTGGNDAAILGLDTGIFSAVSTKTNNGNNHVGLNKSGVVRLYKNRTSTLTISVAEGYRILSIQINGVDDAKVEVKAGENAITGQTGVYQINGSTFSIANTSGNSVDIKSIEISYIKVD